ncbi:MAG TPA: hypothetical protein VJT73_13380 [Polyangiaceae bacterium]|nr:hypothetical protein [Polyangiaceae bacterium]
MNDEDSVRLELEREADDARARLLGTMGALEQRRHEVLDVKWQLGRHAGSIALVCVSVALGVGVLAGTSSFRARLVKERRRKERWRAVSRLWQHPERVAARQHRPLRTLARVFLVAAATLAAAETAKRRVLKGKKRRYLAASLEPQGV